MHLHPYGSFLMCYKKDKWEDAKDALTKSAMVIPMYCLKNPDGSTPENWTERTDRFEVPPRPKVINLPNGQSVPVAKDTMDYFFALNDEIDCHAQFFIKCLKVKKTAGMGDTISGTGWVYHTPKK